MDCPKCKRGEKCDFNFPSINDFKKGGRFSHIKLPISDDCQLPDEIIKYIFGEFHSNQCKPRHSSNIKQSLNDLTKL